METRIVRITIFPHGKAPAKYHREAYKYLIGDAEFLRRASWVGVGMGRMYAYYIPPEGNEVRSLMLDLKVPVDAEIRRLADRLHEIGDSTSGDFFGFHYRYFKAGQLRNRYHGDRAAPDRYPSGRSEHSEFIFGIGKPWGINLIWNNGDEAEPTCRRRGEPGEGN